MLVPGLGVDCRVYKPQQTLSARFDVLEWIEPESQDESLAHYADRMAARLKGFQGYLGGISLGAVVAQEMARSLDLKGVIAIGGCTAGRQISGLFRATLKLASVLPLNFGMKIAVALAAPTLSTFERLRSDQIDLMRRMLREHSPAQARWSCRALLGWKCSCEPPVPVHRIHGENDEIIPLRRVTADRIVQGGRHLISLSHPVEVNQFVTDCLVARKETSTAPPAYVAQCSRDETAHVSDWRS